MITDTEIKTKGLQVLTQHLGNIETESFCYIKNLILQDSERPRQIISKSTFAEFGNTAIFGK
jgi:hypothetical protein